MLKHLRSTWLAGAGAGLLVLSMSGLAAGATLVDDTTPATVSTFEDLNGNGIDDDCETTETADEAAATAAMAIVDMDADGVISVTEAAHSGWVGGKNCNHGGYVSTVAHGAGACEEADDADAITDEAAVEGPNHAAIETTPGTPVADCPEEETEETETDDETAKVCAVTPPTDGAPVVAPMSHVEMAHSEAVGGKNCNHGGAVSESAKAAKAEREAAKAEKRAAREGKVHGHKSKAHGKHGQN